LCGVRADAVITAIKERRARYRSGDRSPDGKRLALVIEGGALRGVCSAAGAVVLAELGLSDVFDEVLATSAAVMNASYFLTNQPLLGISVYFDNCTTRRFVNPWRFWKMVDVDYIFDHVVVHEKPLDLQRLRRSPSELYVAVINRDRGEPFIVDVKSSSTPALTVMKASAAIPVFYNRFVQVDGYRCMDGGLALPLALEPALAHGCTHVLALSTRARDYVSQPPSRWSRFVFDALCARGDARISRLFEEQHLRSREIRAMATGKTAAPPHVHIATMCTSGVENVDRMWASREQLRAAALSYGRKVLSLFTDAPLQWTLPDECANADERTLSL
jgi:predicted patatin/cPLA2 family phospholipase